MPATPFYHHHRVAFYETDAAGIVHFSNFFRYAELCENEFARALEKSCGVSFRDGVHAWPRVHASCDYRSPAHFDDLLAIGLTVRGVGKSSFHYRFDVTRNAELLATGKIVVVCAHLQNASAGAIPLPPTIREALLSRIA